MSYNVMEHVPDGVKVAASVSAPVLTVFGIPLEEWTYILSAIVSLLFILEKLPKMFRKVRDWIKQRACKE